MFLKGGIIKFIKDILFPVYCLSCGKVEGEYLCKKCLETLDFSGVFECPVCHKKNSLGKTCQTCLDKTKIDNETAIFEYKETFLIAKILHEFKYNFFEDLKNLLENFIDIFLAKNRDYFLDIDFVVAVPLHKKRFAERGYNQAEIIASILARKINKNLEDILIRKKRTVQQAKLKREDRIKNLKDAFEIKKNLNLDLVNKKVLLVDDVFTTGTTLNEVAKVLKENGVKIIKCFTIGRGK